MAGMKWGKSKCPMAMGQGLGSRLLAAPRIKGGIGADEGYWQALERGGFAISRCAGCKTWMWPAHFRCGHCGSWDIIWEEVAPEGTVYTYTRNHAVSDVIAERRVQLPFVTLLVELPQAGGARVAGVLQGSDAGLRIGARVRGHIRPADAISKDYTTMVWELVGDAA